MKRSEAAVHRCCSKNSEKFRNIYRKNPVVESLENETLRCFPVNIAKLLRTTFL